MEFNGRPWKMVACLRALEQVRHRVNLLLCITCPLQVAVYRTYKGKKYVLLKERCAADEKIIRAAAAKPASAPASAAPTPAQKLEETVDSSSEDEVEVRKKDIADGIIGKFSLLAASLLIYSCADRAAEMMVSDDGWTDDQGYPTVGQLLKFLTSTTTPYFFEGDEYANIFTVLKEQVANALESALGKFSTSAFDRDFIVVWDTMMKGDMNGKPREWVRYYYERLISRSVDLTWNSSTEAPQGPRPKNVRRYVASVEH